MAYFCFIYRFKKFLRKGKAHLLKNIQVGVSTKMGAVMGEKENSNSDKQLNWKDE